MKNIIIETDIGHDPDDYFALCYLHSSGYNIRAILISPGHKYQIAIARHFCKEVGLNIPIGFSKESDVKHPESFHQNLLCHYGAPLEDSGDGFGHEILGRTLKSYPDSEIFICGPLKNTGRYLQEHPSCEIGSITMQGGFIGYNQHNINVERLDKFIGKSMVPTFNLGGSKKEGLFLTLEAKIKELRFVGKNICHTLVYDRARHSYIKEKPPRNKAMELFYFGMDRYLEKHSDKKFHDPSAAVCHVHPEIGIWTDANLKYSDGKWGAFTNESPNCKILIDLDRDKLWSFLREGN